MKKTKRTTEKEPTKFCGTCTFFNRSVEDRGYCINKNASIYVASTTADAPACRLHTPEEKPKTDD